MAVIADRDFRVSKAVECFAAQFGIHYPYEERPAGRLKITSPIHETLAQHGAVFGSVYGWERPNWFACSSTGKKSETILSFQRSNWFEPVAQECLNVRSNVGLADVSVFSKFEIKGKDATLYIQTLGSNAAPSKDGSITLTHVLNGAGGVLAEFTVTRLSPQHYYLVSAASANRMDEDLLIRHGKRFTVTVKNLTLAYGVLALAGPKSRDLLSKLTSADISNDSFPWLTARQIEVAQVPVTALRVSYVGELGFELHLRLEHLQQLFDSLFSTGQEFGIGLFGAFAINAMRLEKGYRAWGVDLTCERTPIEAGLEFLVKPQDRSFEG